MQEKQKLKHLLEMISQILMEGMVFRIEELMTVAEARTGNPFKVTRQFVKALLDELVEDKLITRIVNGSYGAHKSNNSAMCAALERFIRINEPCSRKDIWLNMQQPVSKQALARLLRAMLEKDRIIRTGWGQYRLKVD